MKTNSHKCVVATYNSVGEADFYFVIVRCSDDAYDAGDHYDVVIEAAKENGYEGQFVTFDDDGSYDWLFERFVWESASVIEIYN